MNVRPTVLIEANELAAALDRFAAALDRIEAKLNPAEVDAYSVDQLAERLNRTPRQIRSACDRGEIRAVIFGGSRLIPRAEVERLLDT